MSEDEKHYSPPIREVSGYHEEAKERRRYAVLAAAAAIASASDSGVDLMSWPDQITKTVNLAEKLLAEIEKREGTK